MRIKFIDTDGDVAVTECIYIGLDADGSIVFANADDQNSVYSVEPLKSIDKLNFDTWTNTLLSVGYIDLTNCGYKFDYYEDSESNNDEKYLT